MAEKNAVQDTSEGNIFLLNADGASVHFKFTGADEVKVLERLDAFYAAAKEAGYKPDAREKKGGGGAAQSAGGQGQTGGTNGQVERRPCPVHQGKSLYKNPSRKKPGTFYWAHKDAETGGYCYGRAAEDEGIPF